MAEILTALFIIAYRVMMASLAMRASGRAAAIQAAACEKSFQESVRQWEACRG